MGRQDCRSVCVCVCVCVFVCTMGGAACEVVKCVYTNIWISQPASDLGIGTTEDRLGSDCCIWIYYTGNFVSEVATLVAVDWSM